MNKKLSTMLMSICLYYAFFKENSTTIQFEILRYVFLTSRSMSQLCVILWQNNHFKKHPNRLQNMATSVQV